MSELANTTAGALSRLDTLAAQARVCSNAIATNTMQLGRVLTEAKKMVAHGQWEAWVSENTGMGKRSAENVMAIYERFGSRKTFDGIEKTKLFNMLSLPDGTEDAFMAEHDVQRMTTREVAQAVKKARAEEQAKTKKLIQDAVDAARQESADELQGLRESLSKAQGELDNLNNTEPEIPQKALDEISRLTTIAADAVKAQQDTDKENARLLQEMQEDGRLIEETSAQLQQAQKELLNLKSSIARGDAERTPSDTLTLDSFAGAVRVFIGACARMPYMQKQFVSMEHEDLVEYDSLLQTVEGWCRDARRAMSPSVLEV